MGYLNEAFKIMGKCKYCVVPGFLIGLSALLVAISTILFGVTIYSSAKVDEARQELERIKREYTSVVDGLGKIQSFTPEYYQNGIYVKSTYKDIYGVLKPFSNIFIASAMIETQHGTLEDSVKAWKKALSVADDNPICNYGLAMAYFRFATEITRDKKDEVHILNESIKYFSHRSLTNDAQAQYHIAVTNLRLVDQEQDIAKKNLRIRIAIETLKNTDPSKHPIGNVDRNTALAFCFGSRYATDGKLKEEYRMLSEKHFALIKDLPEFDTFYKKHYDNCTKK